MKIPQILTIEETDFSRAWARIVRYNTNHGFPANAAKESITLVRLTGNAIGQVEHNVTHPQYPFGKKSINAYCEEFTYDYLEEYLTRPEEEKFSYLYFDRFVNYPTPIAGTVNQLYLLHENLRKSCDSRQLQMITYIPGIDALSINPPCLQRIQVRQIGNGLADLHYAFRSWDVYGAMPSNIIAITKMMNRYVLKDDYRINSINIHAISAHIYDNDSDTAKKVKP